MGMVSDAFNRARMQKHMARPVKAGCQTSLIIERPVRAIKQLSSQLPGDERRNAKDFARLSNRLPRCLIEFGYHRFKRVTQYANYGSI